MKKLLVIMLALALFISLFAVPARPGFRPFKQPDGSTVILELKGDEHFHFAETREGYSVIRDAERWWTYAQKVDGLLVPSMFIAGKDECPFPRHLRPDADAVAALPVNKYRQINWKKFYQPDIMTKDGRADKRVMIVLGAFDDSTYFGTERPADWDVNYWGVKTGFTSGSEPGGTAHDSLYWDSVFFSDNAASFKSYYAEFSFGTWICEGGVLGPLSSGGCYLDYGDGAELTYMTDIADMVGGRIQLYPSSSNLDFDGNGVVEWKDFDGDGNGEVEHFSVSRCGGEQASTGDPNDMWATKYTTTLATSDNNIDIRNPVNAGELTAQDITSDPSLDTLYVRSRTMGIGVHAHENFHAFGAPDFYDYGYQSTTVGDWSLMDGGSWTSDGVQPASRPAHPGAVLQYDIPGAPELTEGNADGFFQTGWRQLITTNGRYPIVGLGLPSSYGGPRMYLVQNGNFQTEDEYFTIENRCDVGEFEGNLPEFGILIGHYDPSEKSTRYNEGPDETGVDYYTYWIEQDGFDPQVHYDHPSDTIYRNVGTAAYAAGESDYFDNTTSAGTNSNDQTVDGPHIIDISAPGDTMWFTVDNCTAAADPVFAKLGLTVHDTITNYGDNDGLADPDELFDLTVVVKNVGANANTVTGTLTSKDGKATVTDSSGAWGNIANGASSENNSDPFRVKFGPGYDTGEYIKFNLAVTSNEGVTTDIEIALLINSPRVTDHFSLYNEVNTGLADPSGVDVVYDNTYTNSWVMWATGTALGNALGQTGQNRLYVFDIPTRGTNLANDYSVYGSAYVVGMDHDSDGYLWYANGDECIKVNPADNCNEVGRLTWHNTDWGGSPMKRFRGITFDNADSLYGYWQVYDPSFVESIFGETKNLGGTASKFWGKPLVDGESYGGHWNNGRGIEWDGTSFWSINIYIPTLYRRDPTTFEYYWKCDIPSVFGSYPSYDIAWQAVSPAGDDAVTPYTAGNRYYMWTINMDNSDVYQLDITDAVLPGAVSIAACTDSVGSGDPIEIHWHPNPSTDFIDHYIVYRDTIDGFYPTSGDSIAVTTDTMYTDVISKSMSKATTTNYYYKVRSVNYHGYSTSTSYTSPMVKVTTESTGIQGVNLSAMQIGTDVVLRWNSDIADGSNWIVTRNGDNVGAVNVGDQSSYKFTDKTVPENGVYEYQLKLVKNDGSTVKFDRISMKYFNNLVFSISDTRQNPIRNDFNLKYSLDREGEVTLTLYDITGSMIRTLANGYMKPGFYSAKVNVSDIASGTYFAVLKQGERNTRKKLLIIK